MRSTREVRNERTVARRCSNAVDRACHHASRSTVDAARTEKLFSRDIMFNWHAISAESPPLPASGMFTSNDSKSRLSLDVKRPVRPSSA